MNMKKENEQFVIYQAPSGAIELRGDIRKETVWATQAQIVSLFNVDQSVVSRHIKNIFKDGEIEEKSNMQKMHIANSDKPTTFYSLDVILSVGYRTNSSRAIHFRKWATKILKQYLVDGYAVNEKRLIEAENKFHELQDAVSFLQRQSKKDLLKGQESEIFQILSDYSKTFSLLEQYDEGKLSDKAGKKAKFVLQYADCENIIGELRNNLVAKREAGHLFAQKRGGEFEGIIKGLYQTFSGKELYPTIEDKASHLLYFTIKDHPFSDGNKRSAVFLFVYYLDMSDYLFKGSGERKINDNALVALALLIAESSPKEKDTMIKIIKNLISER